MKRTHQELFLQFSQKQRGVCAQEEFSNIFLCSEKLLMCTFHFSYSGAITADGSAIVADDLDNNWFESTNINMRRNQRSFSDSLEILGGQRYDSVLPP